MEQVDMHLKNGCAKFGETTVLPSVKDSINFVKFKNTQKMLKKPFVIYADFESILELCEDKRDCQSKLYQSHVPCGYAYKRVSTVEKHDKDIVVFRAKDSSDNVADHFITSLLEEA